MIEHLENGKKNPNSGTGESATYMQWIPEKVVRLNRGFAGTTYHLTLSRDMNSS